MPLSDILWDTRLAADQAIPMMPGTWSTTHRVPPPDPLVASLLYRSQVKDVRIYEYSIEQEHIYIHSVL